MPPGTTAVSAGAAAATTAGRAACQERGVEGAARLPGGAGRAALSRWAAAGLGALGDIPTSFSKREYLIFVRFYKLVSVCTLAFLYSAPNLYSGPAPPQRLPFHPLVLLLHPFPAASSPHTYLCPPVPTATRRCTSRRCACADHAGDAGIAPVAWGLRDAERGGLAGWAKPWGRALDWHCA